MRLRDEFVRFGLFRLQSRADVLAHVHVGDVDGEDFKGGVAVERLAEDRFGNAVGMFEHVLITAGRSDGGHDAFADAGDDRFLSRAANETFQMRAHGHPRLGFDDDAVFGHAVDGDFAGGGVRAVDDLRVDGGLHCFEHGLAGAFGREVDGAGAVEVEAEAGLFRRNERQHHHFNVASGQIMGGKVVDGHFQSRFDGGDAGVHDQAHGHGPQAKRDQFGVGDACAGEESANPNAEEIDEDDKADQQQHSQNAPGDDLQRLRNFSEQREVVLHNH